MYVSLSLSLCEGEGRAAVTLLLYLCEGEERGEGIVDHHSRQYCGNATIIHIRNTTCPRTTRTMIVKPTVT